MTAQIERVERGAGSRADEMQIVIDGLIEQAERFNQLYERLVGSTEEFYNTAGDFFESDGLLRLAGQIPVGTILYASADWTLRNPNDPGRISLREQGWLVCDGGEIWKNDYPNLSAVLAEKWGVPSQSNHVVLPSPEQLGAVVDDTGNPNHATVLTADRRAAWIIRF